VAEVGRECGLACVGEEMFVRKYLAEGRPW